MPINGLTNVPKMFLKLGQIRKGEKVVVEKDGKSYEKPIDLDYFRVTFFQDAKRAEERFREAYGDKPKEINVRLAFPEVSEVWDANFESYLRGGMYAKAASTPERGPYWIFYRDFDSGDILIRDGLPTCPQGSEILAAPLDLSAPVFSYQSKKGEMTPVFFDQIGRLNVVVPEVAEVAVGYLEFRATSPRDIRNISAELAAYDMQARQIGRNITGIPFILRRREEEVTKNINGKLSRGKSWVVHLDLGGEWALKALTVIERLALPEFVDAEVRDVPNGPDWDNEIFDEAEPPAPAPPKTPKAGKTPKTEPIVPKPAEDAPSQPATPPSNGIARPLMPATLRSFLAQKASHYSHEFVASSGQIGLMVGMMEETFAIEGAGKIRRSCLRYLWGVDSSSKMTGSQVLATLDWLKPVRDDDSGAFHPDPMAVQELHAVWTAAQKEDGQLELIK